MYISKHQYIILAITMCYDMWWLDFFIFLFSVSLLHGIPAYRWEIGGRNDLYTYIYRAWAFTDHTRLGYVLSLQFRISLRSRTSLQFRTSLRFRMSLQFRTSLMISYYPLFDSSLKIEIRKRNCPIIPTGISREFTISKFYKFRKS